MRRRSGVSSSKNDPDTRRIDITIARRTSPFTEAQRFETLYLPQTIDQRGVRTHRINCQNLRSKINAPMCQPAATPIQKCLSVPTGEGKLLALFCFKEREDIRSPECWREYEYSDGIEVSYRFKRPYLPEWLAIDTAVRKFVADLDQSRQAAQ